MSHSKHQSGVRVNEMSKDRAGHVEEVAIVGAGILGLYLAHALVRRGVRVKLFEASENPGGLSSSIEFEGNALDVGVRLLPASFSDVVEGFLAALGGSDKARHLPIRYVSRIRPGVSAPADAHAQHLSLIDRLHVLVQRMSHREVEESLVSLGRNRATPLLWRKVFEPFYRRLYGTELDELDCLAVNGIGMSIANPGNVKARLTRGFKDLARPLLSGIGAVSKDGVGRSSNSADYVPNELTAAEGLYPLSGPFGSFIQQLWQRLDEHRLADLHTLSPVEELELEGSRISALKVAGQRNPVEHVVFASVPFLPFRAAGIALPRPDFRTFVQVVMRCEIPLPDHLWEIHFMEGPVGRVFFPQRFQSAMNCDGTLVCAELYSEKQEAEAMVKDLPALKRAIEEQLLRTGTLPGLGRIKSSAAFPIPNAIPAFPRNYFSDVRKAVDALHSEISNVSFTGSLATFAPISPAISAMRAALSLADQLAGTFVSAAVHP